MYQCGSRALSHTGGSALAAHQPPSLAQRSDASAPRRAEEGRAVPSSARRAVPPLPTVRLPAREEGGWSYSAEAVRALFLTEYRKADRRPFRLGPNEAARTAVPWPAASSATPSPPGPARRGAAQTFWLHCHCSHGCPATRPPGISMTMPPSPGTPLPPENSSAGVAFFLSRFSIAFSYSRLPVTKHEIKRLTSTADEAQKYR